MPITDLQMRTFFALFFDANLVRLSVFAFGCLIASSSARADGSRFGLAESVKRVPLEYGTGADLCKVLLNEANDPPSLRQVIPGIGVGIANRGIGMQLSKQLSKLSERATASGETEAEAYRSYLKNHGFLSTHNLGELNAPPGSTTGQNLRKIQQIVGDTSVEALIKIEAKKNKNAKPQGVSVSDADILSFLERIEKGNIFSADDLTALKALQARIQALNTRAEKLRVQASENGQSVLLTWEYLQRNHQSIQEKIRTSKDEEKIYISYPSFENGKLTVKVRAFANLEDYRAFYEDFKRKGKSALNYKSNLEEYTRDYIVTRYLANRFRNLDHSNIVFEPQGYKSEAEAKEIEERKNAYNKLKEEIPLSIASSKEIHPNPGTVRWESNKLHYLTRNKLKFQVGYATLVATALVPFVAKNLFVFGKDFVVSPVLTVWEKEHGDDEDYWIEKCSKAENDSELDQCLQRFRASSQAMVNEKIADKRKKDPKYDGLQERLRQAELTDTVMRELFKPGKMPLVANETQMNLLKTYLGQESYNELTLQMLKEKEKIQKASQPAGPEAPLSIKASVAKDAQGGGSPQASSEVAGSNTATSSDTTKIADSLKTGTVSEQVVERVQKISDDLVKSAQEANTAMGALKAEPVKRTEYAAGHLRKLIELSLRLESYLELGPNDEATSKIDILATKIEQEIQKTTKVVLDIAAQVPPPAEVKSTELPILPKAEPKAKPVQATSQPAEPAAASEEESPD